MNLSDRILEKDKINSFISSLKEIVFAPVSDNGLVFFKESKEMPSFNYQNPIIPLKSLFLPQREELFRYELKKDNIEISPIWSFEKRIIFGAMLCDCKALTLIDKVFLKEPKDTSYALRRENTIIISLLCKEPGDFCFCSSFEDIEAPCDILMVELEHAFYLNVLTEKGNDIVLSCKDANDREKHQAEKKIEDLKLQTKRSILLDKIKLSFENPKWKEISLKCLGCGICTFLCPTCYCFDIQDEKTTRFRFWDSCSFPVFTKMAAHQPRKEQFQRFRNRILHKFLYFKENFGTYGCVGCGRCLKHCPVSIDIIDVINDIST